MKPSTARMCINVLSMCLLIAACGGGGDEGVSAAASAEEGPTEQMLRESAAGVSSAAELPIVAVTASSHDGNVPTNTRDNNLGTRWSAEGDGQWIQFDLGTTRRIASAAIGFYNGNRRAARFQLAVSVDGDTWTTVFSGQSSGLTIAQETINFNSVDARYLRYIGQGNSVNRWNSLTEVDVYAPEAPPPSGDCLRQPSQCGYPDETNTGVPAGTVLTPSGALDINTAGTVISGSDIRGGVAIRAPNVTIRQSRIVSSGNAVAAVRVYDGGSVTIEDSEIQGGTARTAVCCGNYTLRRVEIKGGVDALRADGNVTVVDSFIHDLERVPDSHNDIVQTINGRNIVIRHNTLFAFKGTPGTWPAQGDPMNAVFQLGNLTGDVDNLLIEDNLVNGGNYTFNANWKNVDAGRYTATNIRVVNNRFGRDFRYGPAASMSHGIQFTGNVFADTGEPVR